MLLYQVLITLAAPVLVLALLIRRWRGREDSGALRERLGAASRPTDPGPTLWIHGASNGELNSARVFIDKLRARYPKYRLLITCNTVTARDMARGWGLPQTRAQLAPLDLRWVARRLIRANDIRALIIIENEFWPNRFLAAAEAALPVIVLGARISRRSAARWEKLSVISRIVLESVRLLSAQDGDSQDRFVALGLPNARVAPRLNLKALYDPPEVAGPNPLAGIWPREATWLAASTHNGEDEIIIAAHLAALVAKPELRLILAPRHPDRGDRIARLLQDAGLRVARRSVGASIDAETQVLLADTMGEMPNWYSAARACFIGGSLAPRGGHTPYEPAAHDCALLHGPHLENFARIYSRLQQEDGALLVRDAGELQAGIIAAMEPARAAELCHNARRALTSEQDVDGLFSRLDPLLR
ncbi:3-deoxy-D-manno-octulosonic acid transferase [Poseidonocella sedimentorum]|uniref:3-deoxy-D-manno-octulosonic acid transferase n=1 Tax=Poseidonocella sedimentorum TaxID=871652 RepID=A0A1I6EEU5_9RHOB|nr:glycosyltransferase N-terminal domain-containing protein [Poseidonocella sedimentorum]SFR16253.1 3-deoxy-D-manno-octulosonic-acid transferase [Poseidonocella sedimentorum]